ncbi:MAG: hypothetical protein HGA45_12440 [Chloroflexales bacterium]|nr:hypothetical protein [Chloroflexales bacterium]
MPERILQLIELAEQPHRIELLKPRRESCLRLLVQHAGRLEALEGRLGRLIASLDVAARPCFLLQLHRRLEEVDIESHSAIDLGQLPIGAFTFVAVIADKVADNCPVFLFDEALVILLREAEAFNYPGTCVMCDP